MSLLCNAWNGAPVVGALAPASDDVALGLTRASDLRSVTDEPATPPWQNEDRGWGIVLPMNAGLSAGDLARGSDAPEALRDVLHARNGHVFRYIPGDADSELKVVDFRSGSRKDLDVMYGPIGQGHGELPAYLMIVGTPEEIPWRLQYNMHSRLHVGRLDLDPEGLENYCHALLHGFADPHRIAVGSTDHDPMSSLMRRLVADPIRQWLEDHGQAVDVGPMQQLLDAHPRLLFTTSHGATLVGDPRLAETLGMPVAQNHTIVDVDELPGAVWMCHACCSAGVNAPSELAAYVDDTSQLGSLLQGLAGLGSRTAPLPRKLLGAPHPMRAFIGQVEPTTDWSLRHKGTNQEITQGLVETLPERLLDGRTAAASMELWHESASAAFVALDGLRRRYAQTMVHAPDRMTTFYGLSASDRLSMVLLGDPAVT